MDEKEKLEDLDDHGDKASGNVFGQPQRVKKVPANRVLILPHLPASFHCSFLFGPNRTEVAKKRILYVFVCLPPLTSLRYPA
jgi:hypothetical protein